MEESARCSDLNLENYGVDEEFKSCCEENEDWQDAEESFSEGQGEGKEEVPLRIYDGQEESDRSSLRISEPLQENVEPSLSLSMEFGDDLEKSAAFSDGLEEIVSECSLRLLEGNYQEVVPECLSSQSEVHDEDFSECSLRLCEVHEDASACSLGLSENHEDDVSECSLRLSEGEEEDVLDCELRLSDGHDDDIMESSLRFCESLGGDVSVCSFQLSEDDEDVSECSFIFSEDHENDILKCSVILFENHDEDDDEHLVRVFSKGVSVSEKCDLGSRISGIGVVMEKPHGVPFLQVQKKLDFFVEELIAEHLALMDGLLEALRNGCRKVLAFTDSNKFYGLIMRDDTAEDQLLIALRERIQELADKFESFVLRLAPRSELMKSLQLAQEATGILCQLIECSTCGEDKHLSRMIEMDCSHNLCFDCLCIYVKSKVRSSRIPVKCPQLRCKHYISNSVCRSFLPSTSFESLEGALTETEARNLWRFYCPFPDCSMLLHTHHSSSRETSLMQSSRYCIECPDCCRHVCSRCQVPWHSSMSCEEYQNLPLDERNIGDITLHQLAQRNSWRRCQQCRQMIELAEGCYHVSCWCGHEFCFSCGAEYRYGRQTCQCEFHDVNSESSPAPSEHETELWRWDCLNPLPSTIDGYTEQEKTQLALIQRFLAGGVSLDNHNPCPSPPRSSDSYLDTIKDLNQLPWLESFISVIGDSYQENHNY